MLISVRLYLQGDALQPAEITELLRVQPSRSHARGDSRILSADRTAEEKVGLWVWKISSDGIDATINGCVSALKRTFGHLKILFVDLPNVESAWIDIHVVEDVAADKEDAEVEFVLNAQDLCVLSSFGLPIEFTISVGRT